MSPDPRIAAETGQGASNGIRRVDLFSNYSITRAELAVALEERGFDSVWAAEHSHMVPPRPLLFR
jgi:alkanesulfonate monooxygenase SsuD/methylene tetrahydromethanopterin reductase-like flavin-dependent oxidoreductase (luciferase family)